MKPLKYSSAASIKTISMDKGKKRRRTMVMKRASTSSPERASTLLEYKAKAPEAKKASARFSQQIEKNVISLTTNRYCRTIS